MIGRFNRVRETSMWISPVRSSIVARARAARDDGDGWLGDVATVGLASFLRALGVGVELDVHGRTIRMHGTSVTVVTHLLGRRVSPSYYVRTGEVRTDEVFATLLRDSEYPDLVLVGGIAASALTGAHTQIKALDPPVNWVARVDVQADQRRAAA